MEYFLYAIAIVLTLGFVGLQFYPYYKLKNTHGRPAPDLNSILNPEQRDDQRLLIYFMAPNCRMCKHTTPIIEQLASERKDVLCIDASEHEELAGQFGILGTPAFIVVDGGLIERVKLGALSRDKILGLLNTPG